MQVKNPSLSTGVMVESFFSCEKKKGILYICCDDNGLNEWNVINTGMTTVN